MGNRGEAEPHDEAAADAPGDAREQAPHATPTSPAEPYGPLLVERYRKDDGRALILYSRRRPT
jgi:hypothetical protein